MLGQAGAPKCYLPSFPIQYPLQCKKKVCADVDKSCTRCNPSLSACLTCQPGYKVAAGKCTRKACSDVDAHCGKCDAARTKCLTCATRFKLAGGRCILRSCTADVDEHCVTCDAPTITKCTACKAGFKVANGKCGRLPTFMAEFSLRCPVSTAAEKARDELASALKKALHFEVTATASGGHTILSVAVPCGSALAEVSGCGLDATLPMADSRSPLWTELYASVLAVTQAAKTSGGACEISSARNASSACPAARALTEVPSGTSSCRSLLSTLSTAVHIQCGASSVNQSVRSGDPGRVHVQHDPPICITCEQRAPALL